jgi:hypothetical protein
MSLKLNYYNYESNYNDVIMFWLLFLDYTASYDENMTDQPDDGNRPFA